MKRVPSAGRWRMEGDSSDEGGSICSGVPSAGRLRMEGVSSDEGVPSIARLGMGGVFFLLGRSICLEVADGRGFFL